MTQSDGTLVNPDGSPWEPEFGGQRPPFQPGNDLAVTHGAYSRSRTDPIARRFIEEIVSDEATAYLAAPAYHSTLWNWAMLMAQCELIQTYIEGMSFAEASNSSRGAVSPLDLLARFTRSALTLAKELGLTPLSRARLGKSISSTQVDLATLLSRAEDRAADR